MDFELNVMPWGSWPEARIEIDGLLVAGVALIVAAAVAQVDPPTNATSRSGVLRRRMTKSFWW